MAIAVLLLWALTASAGMRLLFTSSLGRKRSAEAGSGTGTGTSAQAGPPAEVLAETPAQTPVPATVGASSAVPPATVGAPGAVGAGSAVAPPSKREIRRAARARFDTPELIQSRKEPMGSAHELVEFTHPAFAIIGLAFWMGYTLIHNRALAWIAFGLAAATACIGLTWFLSNRKNSLFSPRLIAIHGSGAALTFVLAALTALTARG
jgi:hypothetical protein